MLSFKERCREECTKNVIFLFQKRQLEWDFDNFYGAWEVDWDSEESEIFLNEESLKYNLHPIYNEDEEDLKQRKTLRECYDDSSFNHFVRESYITESVWLSREEAENWGKDHDYRFPHGWRVYGIPAEGELVKHIENT